MNDPVIRPIPLDRLERSPANVRRTEAGKTAFAELKASIAAHGLLENLVARSIGPGEDGGEHYAVIAGGRRLDALRDLASEGAWLETDHPVPCRVIVNGAADSELSLAENVVRVAMHPADQVQAFGALAGDGASVADIAARFGVSERIVEQRLRLGNAAPEILDAYRADAIDLETLKAFAVTADQARQMAVWEQVSDQGCRHRRLAGSAAFRPCRRRCAGDGLRSGTSGRAGLPPCRRTRRQRQRLLRCRHHPDRPHVTASFAVASLDAPHLVDDTAGHRQGVVAEVPHVDGHGVAEFHADRELPAVSRMAGRKFDPFGRQFRPGGRFHPFHSPRMLIGAQI